MNVWDLLLNAKDSKEEEDEQDIKNACIWLKEAGFPQYVQMFKDNEFPISLKLVQEDHVEFDGGSLMALFRRIEILNKATEVKSTPLAGNSSTTVKESISFIKKPQYEIIEDENEDENEDEIEDDEDDDKENVLEQTALSSQWSYEPRTRRWSHIDLYKTSTDTKVEETPPKLENYLGVAFPRSFELRPDEKLTFVSTHYSSTNYKRPNILAFDPHRSFEPIIELNSENNDLVLSGESDKMISSFKVKSKHNTFPKTDHHTSVTPPTTPSSFSKDSLKFDKDREKQNNHILRSASLKLIKAVSRINPNQMSLRHKKDPKPEDTSKLSPSANDGDGPDIKLSTQVEEIDLSKLKIPEKSSEFLHESYSIGDSGWINLRTGSFIARNGGHTESESKTQKKSVISDLDPVIRLLESDVNSLDSMRSRIKSKTSPDSAPSSPVLRNKFNKQEIKKGHQRLSDFESYTRSNKAPSIEFNDGIPTNPRISSPYLTDQSQINEDDKDWSILTKLNRNNISRWSHTSYFKEKAFPQYHHIIELSVNKVNILKKLAVLSCTSMLEKHCPSQKNVFNWRIPRLLPQKQKMPLENSNFVFGVHLSALQNRYGQPIPPAILNIFAYLREHGPVTQGIFRKTGMKCRIKELRKEMEKDENLNNFDGYNVNDIADILKTFFRDLPDRLLTNKLSSTLLAIYNYVPSEHQTEGLKWALLSLPDENRVVLEYLIKFLAFLSTFSDVTKMDVKNLSLCFAPSLFNFQNDGISNNSMSSIRIKKSNGPNSKLLAEQNAAHLCVMGMIENANNLFQITNETLKKASHNSKENSDPKDVTHLISTGLWNDWIREKINVLKNDATNHKAGWTNISKDFIKKLHGPYAIIEQLSYRKIGSHHSNSDGVALRTWKVVVDIDVSPGHLFANIRDKRHLWDPDMSYTEVIKEVTEYIDLVKFVSNNPDGSFVGRQFNLLRGFQLGVNDSAHMIFSESIDADPLMSLDACNGRNQKSIDILSGQIFCDNFMIEAISSKLTRVTWISRVDLSGHHSEWYTNHWGHNMVRRAACLKNFSRTNSSLKSSSESGMISISDFPVSPDKDDSCSMINPKILEFASETVL